MMNLPTGHVCRVEIPFKMLFYHNVLVTYEHNFSYLTLISSHLFPAGSHRLFFPPTYEINLTSFSGVAASLSQAWSNRSYVQHKLMCRCLFSLSFFTKQLV